MPRTANHSFLVELYACRIRCEPLKCYRTGTPNTSESEMTLIQSPQDSVVETHNMQLRIHLRRLCTCAGRTLEFSEISLCPWSIAASLTDRKRSVKLKHMQLLGRWKLLHADRGYTFFSFMSPSGIFWARTADQAIACVDGFPTYAGACLPLTLSVKLIHSSFFKAGN